MRSVVESFHGGCAAVAVISITGVHGLAAVAAAVIAGFASAMLFYFTRSR